MIESEININYFLAEGRMLLLKKKYKEALLILHKAINRSRDSLNLQIESSELIAQACDGLGQHFFASEFMRYSDVIRDNLPDQPSESTWMAKNEKLISMTRNELTYCVTNLWHRLGVPVPHGIEYFNYMHAYLVTESSVYLSNMTWIFHLPLAIKEENNEEHQLLCHVTAFDFNIGEHVKSRYAKTLSVGPTEFSDAIRMNHPLIIITHAVTPHLGIMIRVPTNELEIIVNSGLPYLDNKLVPLDLCYDIPNSNTPKHFTDAAIKAENNGAELFAQRFHFKAAEIHDENKNNKEMIKSLFNFGKSLSRVKNKNANKSLQRTFLRAKEAKLDDLADEIGQYLTHKPSPIGFIFDPSSGKVLGGQYADEALFEMDASSLLNKTWEKTFPEYPSPFYKGLAMQSFNTDAQFRNDPFSVVNVNLGTTFRASADTTRLKDYQEIPKMFYTNEEEYITSFSSRIARAIYLMHKKLSGTFTSTYGTSISSGNISIQGFIFDYETVQTPDLDCFSNLENFQKLDIKNAIILLSEVAEKLGRTDLFALGLKEFCLNYTQNPKIGEDYIEESDQEIITSSGVSQEFVKKLTMKLFNANT